MAEAPRPAQAGFTPPTRAAFAIAPGPGQWYPCRVHWSLVYLISEWAVRLAMLFYVPQRRNAAASRTWLLLIFLLPAPGLVLYTLFGRIYLPRRRIAQQRRASRMIRASQAQMPAPATGTATAPHPDLGVEALRVAAFAERLGDFKAVPGNHVEFLTDYDGTIDRLITDLDAARQHIHLLYYIYGDDAPGRRVAEALARAAARGVTCRVLLDAVGSKAALARLAPRLTAQGIEVTPLLPVGLFRRNAARFDLRNHRKLAIIDGRIGYTGSQNLVAPGFVPGYPNEDLTLRLTGPIVAQLQAVFLADRYFERGGPLDHPGLFAPHDPPPGSTLAQLVPSGPGYLRMNGQQLFITLLYAARHRIVMTTPYFVPDEPFLEALHAARLRGVEVALVLSEHANQRLTQFAQRSYYDDLLSAGVRLHLYQPRFLHAKHLAIDDDFVVIGSSNIDIRSFALNAEVSLLLYGPGPAAAIRQIQDEYFAHSRLLTLEEWRRRSPVVRTLQNIARLADSLL